MNTVMDLGSVYLSDCHLLKEASDGAGAKLDPSLLQNKELYTV